MNSLAKIGWGITGAGHLLAETFKTMEKLSKKHEISCFLSSSASRVIPIYGLSKKLPKICPGGYRREIISENDEGPSSPLTGRFLRRTYRALIVSPASSNTVAKVVTGISDTLITNAIAQAGKGRTPIVIVPTDQEPGETKTAMPYSIDRTLCEKCESCSVILLCPANAIVQSDGLPRINLSKCDGCNVCLMKCPYGAISFGQEVVATTRAIDLENVNKMRMMENFVVLAGPMDIPRALSKILGGRRG